MCVIFYQEAGDDRLDKDVLRKGEEHNPHGMGIMYAFDDKLHVWRGLDDFEQLWNHYTSARDAEAPTAVHFRYATVGEPTVETCHPFVIDYDSKSQPQWAFMHNGTFTGRGFAKSDIPEGKSDTQHFLDKVVRALPENFLNQPPLYEMVYRYTTGNRLLFMDRLGRVSIMHKGLGKWYKDRESNLWVSKSWDKYLDTEDTSRYQSNSLYPDSGNGYYRGSTTYCGKCGERDPKHSYSQCPLDEDVDISPVQDVDRSFSKAAATYIVTNGLDPAEVAKQVSGMGMVTAGDAHAYKRRVDRLRDEQEDKTISNEEVSTEDINSLIEKAEEKGVDIVGDDYIEDAIFYEGLTYCWDCIDKISTEVGDNFRWEATFEVPTTTTVPIICTECGEKMHDPLEA